MTALEPSPPPVSPPGRALRRLLLFAVATMIVIFLPYYLLTLDPRWPIVRDGTGLVVGRDFLNFWLYGRAAWAPDPARYYQLDTYWAAIEAVAGGGYPGQQWSYPPTLMLLLAPFGTMPYFVALALWTALGLGAFIAALRLWTRDPLTIAVAALAPAAVFGLISGQLAYLGAAAMLAALRWRDRRPLVAGIFLGLLTIKPQLGLLVPVLLLATRNGRAIAAAAVTALALAGASALLWGGGVWAAYIALGLPHQASVLTDETLIVAPFMPTMFMTLRLAGAGMGVANAVQMLLTLGAAAAVALVFRRRPAADDPGANALFLAASVIATPYLMAYDLLALTVAVVLLGEAEPRARLLVIVVFLLPLVQMATASAGIPGAGLIALAAGGWLWREIMRRPHAAPAMFAPAG